MDGLTFDRWTHGWMEEWMDEVFLGVMVLTKEFRTLTLPFVPWKVKVLWERREAIYRRPGAHQTYWGRLFFPQ